MNPGDQLGPYEILGPLGAGGMGEVYRARDPRLDRDVAIKVLPEDFAADPERLARFEREAKLLAQLNHSNIAGIHGLEDAGGVRFIAMECVEGETLAERLAAQGRIEVDEALEIARQIAQALETAHEAGIVHRDLKPANVKITPDDKVKVLDFGLAKAYEADGSASDISPDLSHSPTMAAATRTGVIMGTAAYMSPEQARGKAVDRRADIWAFGCVLYEMLTGKQAFGGDTVSDTLAAILKEAPDAAALPVDITPSLRRLIGHCLDKDPRRRLRDIGDGRTEIENLLGADTAPSLGAPARDELGTVVGGAQGSGIGRYVTVALVTAAIGTFAFWMGLSIAPEAPAGSPGVIRATIKLPPGHRQPRLMAAPLALSPDGSRLAYAARDETGVVRLFLRTMDSGDVSALPGTTHADSPFFSPDGRWLGFASSGSLRKIAIEGGAPQRLARLTSEEAYASWGPGGTIVFSPGLNTGLWTINADEDGTPERLTEPDFAGDGYAHVWPQYLPGGGHILFQLWGQGSGPRVLDLETGRWHRARQGGSGGDRYLPSGHIVYADSTGSGSLYAAAFDVQRFIAEGTAVPVLADVRFLSSQSAYPFMAVSGNGTVVYARQGVDTGTLMWVDREGNEVPVRTDESIIAGINLSPDGRNAVYHDEHGTLWTLDLARNTPQILVANSPDFSSNSAVWNADGLAVTFASNREGSWDLHEVDVGGRADPRALLVRPYGQFPVEWSDNGEVLVYFEDHPETGMDVWVLPAGGEPVPLANSSSNEYSPVVSPDGRLIAYVSDESGQHEVYVKSYPEQDFTIASTGGGEEPRWSPDGSELFFTQGYRVMAVKVTTDPDIVVSEAEFLFDKAFARGSTNSYAMPYYDVAADGRFLMVSDRSTTEFQLIVNWFDDLERLVPTGASR